MTKKSFFSIITCTYNSEKYIKDNIHSVFTQTFKDYEHVFIDGYSSDDTVRIIKDYQNKNRGRVRSFSYPPRGITNAFNKGIKKANGRWLIFLNSDDYFYSKNSLQKIYNHVQSGKAEIYYGKAKFVNCLNFGKNFRIIPHRKIYQRLNYWLLLLTNYVPHQSVVTKAELFKKHGLFDENYRLASDYEFWVRIASSKVINGFIDDILVVCRSTIDSASVVKRNLALKEDNQIVDKYSRFPLNLFFKFVRIINSKRSFY